MARPKGPRGGHVAWGTGSCSICGASLAKELTRCSAAKPVCRRRIRLPVPHTEGFHRADGAHEHWLVPFSACRRWRGRARGGGGGSQRGMAPCLGWWYRCSAARLMDLPSPMWNQEERPGQSGLCQGAIWVSVHSVPHLAIQRPPTLQVPRRTLDPRPPRQVVPVHKPQDADPLDKPPLIHMVLPFIMPADNLSGGP